jgi:hypothetical protein
MIKFLSTAILSLCIFICAVSAEPGRRIEILFLGDQGHHKPAERAHWLTEALGPKGINLTYTEDISRNTMAC